MKPERSECSKYFLLSVVYKIADLTLYRPMTPYGVMNFDRIVLYHYYVAYLYIALSIYSTIMVSSNSCGKIIDRAIVMNTPPSIVDLYYAACPVGTRSYK